jgi:anti-anti-sigma regulatory factor
MDEDLARLQRDACANPADVETARRLEAALGRAGQTEALRARYRFKFLCPLTFEDLEPTGDDDRRHCSRCERDVHLVLDPDAYLEAAAAGRCVSVPSSIVDAALERLVVAPGQHGAEDGAAPCLVESPAWLAEAPLPGVPGGLLLTPSAQLTDPAIVATFQDRALFVCSQARAAVLDLAGVTEVSDEGLAALVRVADGIATRGGRMGVAAATQPVSDLFELLGLGGFFSISSSIEEATVEVLKPPEPPREVTLLGRIGPH